ncbi:FAD-dependent oxidoreductase [Aquincola sp. S2]|uniref:FAD-dependent oxidoreductase n=1 Tax=Pseudaquabacterium terrae TaxID=2732868 RepID=A0ABX2ELU5_9BURK|nr:FAD-dependent oxidoreductase [Aquabacterium terrae]NRF69489.1 FAD-dependent oxidoreductase [Aquabacterium terrae]
MQPRTLVIAGGGFAGTTLAQQLAPRLPAGWQLLVISEESYTTFNPMLAEVVGAAVFPEHVIVPIRALLQHAPATVRFVMGRIGQVDSAARRLRCDTLAGPREIGYEHLVLAIGQRANLALLPGLAEHALPLKLVGDALHIRNRVLQRLAAIELTGDAAQRAALGRFVIVGGGFSGVEVAGSLADFLRSARRYYPRVQAGELSVTLLHDGARLLPELPARLGDAAARSLRRRGIDVRLGARAARVEAEAVELADGTRLATRTVVCTIGTRAQALAETLGLPSERGRLRVAPDASVPGVPGLWAIGDCAALPNAADGGKPCPPTAQFAVAQAQRLADNLLARIAGTPTRAFGHRSKAMMATTGHLKGVALLGRLPLAGLPAWLLWRAVYLLRMPTLGRKLRIWVEWTWGLVFPLDITHLRFTRTADAAAEAPSAAPFQR